MSNYEKIQSEAMGNYGIFSYRSAHDQGVSSAEIHRWVRKGRAIKVGRGVYRLTSYPSMGRLSDLAALLADVGNDSYLYGESVLGFLELCPTRPDIAYVAAPSRKRRALGSSVKIVHGAVDYRPFHPQGIACQRVADAIRASVGTVEPDRLVQATRIAVERGLLDPAEGDELVKEIDNGETTAQ